MPIDDKHFEILQNVEISGNLVVSGQIFASSIIELGPSGGSLTDHGALGGLADNDHPQYALSSLVDSHRDDSLGVSSTVFDNSATWDLGGGIVDHSGLLLLNANDHPQYVLSATNATLSSTVDSHVASSTVHFTEASIDHANIQNVGTNTHAQLDTHVSVGTSHISDSTIHFAEASIDHTAITNIGTNTHPQIDSHIASSTVHFTEASIDHGAVSGLGDNDHPQYVLSATNAVLSSTFESVSSTVFDNSATWNNDTDTTDHTALSNIGTNTHAQIDTHIADSTVHFTEASIDHGSIGGLIGNNDHPQYALSSLVDSHRTDSLGVSSTVFDNSATWSAGGGGGSVDLSGLTDVSAQGAVERTYLTLEGSTWVASGPVEVSSTAPVSAIGKVWLDLSEDTVESSTLSGLSDTSTIGAVERTVLTLEGTTWVASGAVEVSATAPVSAVGKIWLDTAVNITSVFNTSSITSTATVTDENEMVFCNGTFSVFLPTSVGRPGKVFMFINTGVGTVTLDADGTETINGSLTEVMAAQYDARDLISDGANWFIKG